MFGFGKSRLDEQMMGKIALELSMYKEWLWEHRGRGLMHSDAQDIARRILTRENFKIEEQHLFWIANMAADFDTEKVNAFRKQTGFDSTIDGFCTSIGITYS